MKWCAPGESAEKIVLIITSDAQLTPQKRSQGQLSLESNPYPYPPVEAQTRAPLSNKTCTHSGRL